MTVLVWRAGGYRYFFRHLQRSTGPEIIDPVFVKTSQNARFLLSENERFGLVFMKTGSINSGTGIRRKFFIEVSKYIYN
jgi:hypothetical protein